MLAGGAGFNIFVAPGQRFIVARAILYVLAVPLRVRIDELVIRPAAAIR